MRPCSIWAMYLIVARCITYRLDRAACSYLFVVSFDTSSSPISYNNTITKAITKPNHQQDATNTCSIRLTWLAQNYCLGEFPLNTECTGWTVLLQWIHLEKAGIWVNKMCSYFKGIFSITLFIFNKQHYTCWFFISHTLREESSQTNVI